MANPPKSDNKSVFETAEGAGMLATPCAVGGAGNAPNVALATLAVGATGSGWLELNAELKSAKSSGVVAPAEGGAIGALFELVEWLKAVVKSPKSPVGVSASRGLKSSLSTAVKKLLLLVSGCLGTGLWLASRP